MIEIQPHWTIKIATTMDQQEIYQLLEQEKKTMAASGVYQWTETYPNQAIVERDIIKQRLFILVIANEIITVATVSKLAQRSYKIERVATKHQYAGKGYATQLVNDIIKQIKEKKGKYIYSSTNHTNQQMQSFFTKLGFKKVSESIVFGREQLGSFYEYLKKI